MRGAGRLQAVRNHHVVRPVRGEHGGQDRDQQHEDRDRAAEHRQAVFEEAAAGERALFLAQAPSGFLQGLKGPFLHHFHSFPS